MRNVITISREAGSNGDAIGYELAQRLGYTCVNRSFVDLIARKTRVAPWQVERIEQNPDPDAVHAPARGNGGDKHYDEREGRDVDQLIQRLGYGEALETEEYLNALHQVMNDLADIGHVVIIGRGAQVILHDRPGAFHVRILAPQDERIDALRQRDALSQDKASEKVALIDSLRSDLLRRMGWEDDDQKLYNMILDTAGKSVADCVDLILDKLRADERESLFEPAIGKLEETR